MNDKEIALEKLKLNVEVWKKVIDVQQHFNDLEMKVRNFGLLIISAFISVIGVSLKSNYEINIFESTIPVGSLIALVALFVWNLVFFVDVYWYHPLLKGAVLKGIDLENEIKDDLPEIGLTQAIGESSAIKFLWWKKLHSTTKAKIFYNGVSVALVAIAISLMFFTSNGKENTQAASVESQFSVTNNKLNTLLKQSEILKRNLSELSESQVDNCPQNSCSVVSLQGELELFKKEIDDHMDRHLNIIRKIVK
ncbi:hypothetical protein [Pseudocolwellia agarivorans]|uniref:hypothetical protein n=1 Tax=Pseudocolwellia agarivorans TaxID=1911682 RepID=UPI0009873222|nr:hypothetical protein [Pseudocolwellia agarivorans]